MTKLLIDCDPGHDDAVAILYAAKHLDLVGITTVFGNNTVDNTTRNALAVCALGGIEVPVAKGFAGPFVGEAPFALDAHGKSGMDGAELPAPTRDPLDIHAVEFLIETASEYRGELTVAIIGAHTNVAVALKLEPRLREWIRGFTIMGGSAGVGNVTPVGCINVVSDPESASVVFSSGVPITWIGYELTRTVLIEQRDIERLRREGGAVSKAVADLASFYKASYERIYGISGAPMHDVCAIVPFVRPGLIAHEDVAATVELGGGLTRGMTVIDRRGIRPGTTTDARRRVPPANARLAVRADVRVVIDDVVATLLAYDRKPAA